MSTCQGCDKPIPPSRGHSARKWCSDPCRKRTLYGRSCAGCGLTDNGSEGKRDSYLCAACKHERDYGAREARIVELWGAGVKAHEIARELGMIEQGVLNHVNKRRNRGQPFSRRRRRNRELWPAIQRLRFEGLTNREIGERLGASKENIRVMTEVMRAVGVDVPDRQKAAA